MRHLLATGLCLASLNGPAAAGDVLGQYERLARQENPAFERFSAARGKRFYEQRRTDSEGRPSGCFSCHTPDPGKPGKTRANKVIGPMAVGANPQRFTDPRKTEKWFRRNCADLLGRACTAQEKGDFIEFLAQFK